MVALGLIIGGAELFVEELTKVAEETGVSSLVLALIIAPLATELPEKLNSVIWMRRGKDMLAIGNITGAMAFQATIPVALGLTVTDWQLDKYATAAGVLGLAGRRAWRCGGWSGGGWAGPPRWRGPRMFLALVVFVAVG